MTFPHRDRSHGVLAVLAVMHNSLYAPAVHREPHKYVDGSYLIVPSARDSTRQLVFETDGRVVTALRAGMLPMVRWVEGCS
jgi:hypothetical protein